MLPVPFEELPVNIQVIFESVKKQCFCFVRVVNDKKRYYVNHNRETSVFTELDDSGTWHHLQSYASTL
jgi:hypothetical protein